MTKKFKKTQNPNPNYIPPTVRDNAPDYMTFLFYETNATEWFFCTTENRVIPNKGDFIIVENNMYSIEKRIIDYEVGQVYVFVKYIEEIKRGIDATL